MTSRTKYRKDVGNRKYLGIKRHLQNQILSGTFASGDALPKERDLAVSLDVATGTLRQALQELEADGLIRRVRGQGTFVTTAEQHQSFVRSKLFTLIAPQVREGLYPSLIHGLERAVAGTGYQITVGNSRNELTRQEALLRQAVDSNVAGVAIVPTTFPLTPPEQIQILQDHRIPFVFCHRSVEGVTAPLVTWSAKELGRMMAWALLERGHRRIAMVVAHRDPKLIEFIGSVQQTLGEWGLDPGAFCVRYHGERLPGVHARAAIRDVLADLLSGAGRPTAIHCHNLPDAEQVFLLAGEMGLSIPQDLSLIYFGDSHPAGGLAQRLTCAAVDAQSIGLQAVGLLRDISSGQSRQDANQQIEVPLTLLPRETVGAPPEAIRVVGDNTVDTIT